MRAPTGVATAILLACLLNVSDAHAQATARAETIGSNQAFARPLPGSIYHSSTVRSVALTIKSASPIAAGGGLTVPNLAVTTAASTTPRAGIFVWPFSPYSTFNRNAQYFMKWNSTFQKYHLADDWNGNGGTSTDLGLPLYAIADGVVQFKDDTTATNSFGKVLIVRYALPDGTQVDSVYEHMQRILVGGPLTPVYKGLQIATIGDANGYYLNAAHLHWEMRRDLTITNANPITNPYYNPLTLQTALRYTSPSLFVDDRKAAYTNGLAYRNWTYITWYFNAPSATAYVDYNGTKYSLRMAVDAGLIYNYVYEQRNGQWYYYSDITNVFFGARNTYAIYSYVQGANVTIFVPGDQYRADRSRQDMIKAASRDPRFRNIRTDEKEYGENLSWDTSFELRYMGIGYVNSRGMSGTTYFYQATRKTNPLERYTIFFDPDTGQYPSWIQVNLNTLD